MVDKKLIKKIGVEVSALGFGCMRFPTLDGDASKIDEPKAIEMLDYAMANGVNYYDTAYQYHDGYSANFLGKALVSRYPRDSFYLANKIPLWLCKDRQHMIDMFEDQLVRCKTDHFDFYLIHSVDRSNFDLIKEYGAYDFLKQKQKEGVIKYLGFSFHDNAELLETVLNTYEFDFCQLQLNYLDWTLQKADEVYAVIEKHDIQCMVMEPVRGGFLAKAGEEIFKKNFNATPPEMALRWVGSKKNVAVVLSGMSSLDQVKENIETFTNFEPIKEEDLKVYDEVLDQINSMNAIPCTGCRYCMPCPAGVHIPAIFRAYNDFKRIGRPIIAMVSYRHALSDEEKATSCVECRACMEHCPQHIEIPEMLKVAHEVLENVTTPDRMEGYDITVGTDA